MKYLGVNISDVSKDDKDISNQMRNLYSRGNCIIKHFRNCSDDVKTQLFKSYYNSFYCCHLWSSFNVESLRTLE